MDKRASLDSKPLFGEQRTIGLITAFLGLQAKLRSDRMEYWSKKFDDVDRIELHVLLLLQVKPDIILGEIKDDLGVPNSTLTGIVDRMERKGLVERAISPRDRRSYGLKMTAKGKDIRKEHDRVLVTIANRMLEALDDDAEREALVRLWSKASKNMKD